MKLRPEQVDALGGCAPCQFTPVESGKGPTGDASGSLKPASVVVLDPTKPHWIVIALVDTNKQPVPFARYLVTLPNGSEVPGTLDAMGRVRIEGIDPGNCTVAFPTIDRRDFK